VPVGEFVTALNEQARAGRMKVFGGSNWTAARVDAFNDYARKHNLQPMAAISNNFSLARMVEPVWGGCLASSDADFLAWHRKTKMTLMSWSSQARGFFVLGGPQYKGDAEMARCWYSPDNFQRLERAKELAKKKGVGPLQIALAYVLFQTFPTFALIGPRSIEETRTSLQALTVELTEQETRWLNLEA
jgi:aryl-alcohol dehydrogenase-like predicted oxidoreductase